METIRCDAVLMSVRIRAGFRSLAQSGATLPYDTALQQHRPGEFSGVFAVKTHASMIRRARQDGRDAGAAAAAHSRGGHVGARYRAEVSARSHIRFPCSRTARARDFATSMKISR